MQQLVQEISDGEELPAIDARFLDCGLDSLMIVEMSRQIQVELEPGHDAPATLIFDHPRICDLSDYLVGALFPVDSAGQSNPDKLAAEIVGPPPTKYRASQTEEIVSMTEEEALAELIKELDS